MLSQGLEAARPNVGIDAKSLDHDVGDVQTGPNPAI